MPLANTIHHSSFIYNQLKRLNLCNFYSRRVINHLMSILISIFISGYHGKTTGSASDWRCVFSAIPFKRETGLRASGSCGYAFLSTDVSLSTDAILSYYVCRWPIEIFFCQCKDKLALDSYQIRSAQGIRRFWQLMSLAHFMCVAEPGEINSFENGYHQICDIIQLEKYHYIFQCVKESHDFGSFMKYVA